MKNDDLRIARRIGTISDDWAELQRRQPLQLPTFDNMTATWTRPNPEQEDPRFELVMCECEHVSHFDRGRLSPHGNPTHKYGVKYYASFMRKVKTIFNTYNVCKDCLEDCWDGRDDLR